MRLTSLIILLALVGGAGYLWFFQREWVESMFQKGKNVVAGYTPAKSPDAAMEKFREAVKARDYQAAALYCTGDYAEQLKNCHSAARDVGHEIDRLRNVLEEKGLNTENSKAMLYYLDPFPPNLKVNGEVKKKGDDKAYGAFAPESLPPGPPQLGPGDGLDPRWLLSALNPPSALVELTRVGSGDEAHWKLNIPLLPARREAIRFFMDNHKALLTGLKKLRDDALRDRYLKRDFEPHLKTTLKGCQG